MLAFQTVQLPALPALLQPARAVAWCRGLCPGQQPVVLQQLLGIGGARVRDTGQAESGAPVLGLPLAGPSISEDLGYRVRHRERSPGLSPPSRTLQANQSQSKALESRRCREQSEHLRSPTGVGMGGIS